MLYDNNVYRVILEINIRYKSRYLQSTIVYLYLQVESIIVRLLYCFEIYLKMISFIILRISMYGNLFLNNKINNIFFNLLVVFPNY